MTTPRRPKGYVGTNHETIGSDVLAILKVLHVPEVLLGPELYQQVKVIQPDGWYPMSALFDPVERIHRKVGDNSLLRIGSELFQTTHAANVKANVKSAHQLLHGLDALYHHANRGEDIGGWRVLQFETGKAIVEKTTPYHCILEQGILIEALGVIGIPAIIQQQKCFRRGDDCCEYVITSYIRDHRWSGEDSAL